MRRGYASLLVFPLTDKMPVRLNRFKSPEHRIKINGHPTFVLLEAVKFGLESGYITETELRTILLSVKINARKR